MAGIEAASKEEKEEEAPQKKPLAKAAELVDALNAKLEAAPPKRVAVAAGEAAASEAAVPDQDAAAADAAAPHKLVALASSYRVLAWLSIWAMSIVLPWQAIFVDGALYGAVRPPRGVGCPLLAEIHGCALYP